MAGATGHGDLGRGLVGRGLAGLGGPGGRSAKSFGRLLESGRGLGRDAGMPGRGTVLSLLSVSGYMRVGAGEPVPLLSESRAATAGVNLAGGHTGGTFYIRARLRAGACVPAVSETLGR